MLSTYAMFKNELNIQLLSRGKVKQVYSCAIDMRFDFWQSKQSIPFGGLNFSCLYFSSQLCWKLHFNNFDFGSLNNWSFSGSASSCSVDISAVSSLCCCPKNAEALFVLTSICIHAHQERGPHLRNLPCTVFIQMIKCRWTLENWAFMSYSLDFGSYFTFNLLKF